MLTRLLGEQVYVMGHLTLKTICGKGTDVNVIDVSYLIMDALSPYNIIIEWPSIDALETVVSTMYIALKYPFYEDRVGTIWRDQLIAHEFYQNSLVIEMDEPALNDIPLWSFKY